ncbi:MAG: hypothetical protein FWE23_07850 [Chitinivibrionia bacterium]|nr:hypothetical protein [Chitinivibrionia bacterium]
MIKRLYLLTALFAATVFASFGTDITFQKNISLIEYQSVSPHIVHLQDVKHHNGKIYVALHYLDNAFQPAANSLILEMDESGNVLREFTSNFANVYQILFRGNSLFVIDRGSWLGGVAGGITKIDLETEVKTTILDGNTEGRSPIKMEFASDNSGFLLMGGAHWGDETIAKFTLNGNTISLDYNAVSTMRSITSISLNTTTNNLWFARGSRVYRYCLTSETIEFNTITTQPTQEIISIGDITLTIESNFTAGTYGVIISDSYTRKSVIDGDAGGGFADGNFYILERSGSGRLILLSPSGEIIRQFPFDTRFFNPHGVAGNGKGNIFVGSKEELALAVFALEGFEVPPTLIRNNPPRNTRYGILLKNPIVSDVARIRVKTPEPARINLRIFDVLGNVVFSVDDVGAGFKPAPTIDGAIFWNLTNNNGRRVANGAYLIIVEATGISGKIYRYRAKIGVNGR